MKFLKKILLFSLVSSLSFLLAACANLTPNNAIEKIVDTNKNIQSIKFNSSTKVETINNDNTTIGEVDIEGKTTKNPHSEKLTIKNSFNSNNGESNIEESTIYLKDNALYIAKDNSWIKYTGNRTKLKYKNLNNLEISEKILDIYKKIAHDFKVQSDGDKLILNYIGSGDHFKDLLFEIINSTTPGQQLETNTFDNTNFNNVTIKYIVKKSDFSPVSSEITMNLVSKDDSSQSLNIKQKIDYSEINAISEINLPSDITNNISQTIDN